MKINDLMRKLREIKKEEGNIEVTCTGCLDQEKETPLDGGPFESTVETLLIGDHPTIGRTVRIWM